MVVPGLLGYWIDQRIGSRPLFTVVGFGLGLALGMWHLIRMSSTGDDSEQPPADAEH